MTCNAGPRFITCKGYNLSDVSAANMDTDGDLSFDYD
jgi:hypothetical protein